MTRFQFPVRNLPLPIQEIATEMEHLVDRMFPRGGGTDRGDSESELAYAPPMNVAEDDQHYEISLDLPGVSVEDVKLEIHEDRLSISGSRRPTEKGPGTTFHREERSFGCYRRTVVLPKNVDQDKVAATYRDGVLTIVIPKQAKAQPRTILIRTGGATEPPVQGSNGSHPTGE